MMIRGPALVGNLATRLDLAVPNVTDHPSMNSVLSVTILYQT